MPSQMALIVDDDDLNRRLAQATLAGEGYDTVCVRDAGTALVALARFSPDVVLMDIGLPDVDGLELTRELVELGLLHGADVIAVSAYELPEYRERARAAGCRGFIAKPIDTRRFGAQVAALRHTRVSAPT